MFGYDKSALIIKKMNAIMRLPKKKKIENNIEVKEGDFK